MFTVFSRILHFGVTNFWRNGWLSVATVAVMVLALLAFGGFLMFNAVTRAAAQSVEEHIDIAVYFYQTTPEDEILRIKSLVEALPEAKAVTYISREEALVSFQETHKNDPDISQALRELEENPLEAWLRIKANEPEQYAGIAEYLEDPSLKQSVHEVTYYETQGVIDRLTSIIRITTRGGLIATVVMAFVAGLVIFNTVWIAIYSNREEVSIMRAVGASNFLVRGPYMIEGVISGIAGSIISTIVLIPLVHIASPYINILISEFNLVRYFYSFFFQLLFYQIIFGACIGGISSFLAVRRYLKN